MRKSRKGFTLVELLIVIAILATLTAAMTASITGSTAKAKASTIAANVETMKTVAQSCASNGGPLAVNRTAGGADTTLTSVSDATAENVLAGGMAAWADFSDADDAKATIKYAADLTTGDNNDGKGPGNWAVIVDFSNDPDKDNIRTELQKIKGYRKYYKKTHVNADDTASPPVVAHDETTVESIFTDGTDDNDYKFKVFLISGTITPVS
ncbi:MAG: prepilin-type N-terminal cleavage/methylation domain-containing protein [Synergistaceae bacterium]|nr:prepilin-type N-terminal cleavage/methylation domain-containing protein [Synergistaceae bacterium]MBQ7170401.1 prepilin-type N-terminal cleavage/methylation domain-containing protein [Synergistaceae bacterium]